MTGQEALLLASRDRRKNFIVRWFTSIIDAAVEVEKNKQMKTVLIETTVTEWEYDKDGCTTKETKVKTTQEKED